MTHPFASTSSSDGIDNFSDDIQAAIAGKMTTSDLARMRAVSKSWKNVADRLAVRKSSFKSTWGLAGVHGEPNKPNFYLAAGLGHFVVKVKQGPKASVASLLVKFKTDSMTLRVINNCSEFSLHCRTYIYVPVTNRQELAGRWATFASDRLCQRQLIVLEDFTRDQSSQQSEIDPETVGGTLDTLARGTASATVEETRTDLEEAQLLGSAREALLKKLSRQMGRGLNIDEGTAAYYLEQTKGDMKKAFIMYKEDLAWETRHPVGFLPLKEPVQASD